MDDAHQEAIGRTVDALLRPRTPLPASGILRVADLGGLSDDAEEAGLEVVYTYPPGEDILDISDRGRIPPFDLLAADLGDNPDDVFTLVLRFLRVRRPVAYVLTAARDSIGADFLRAVENRAGRLGYRHSHALGAFIVGALMPEPFTWPDDLTITAVLAQMARDALANGRN